MSTNILIGTGDRRIKASILPDAAEIGLQLATRTLEELSQAQSENRPYLLGCPAGRTGQTTYRALGQLAAERAANLSNMFIVMMDNYVTETAGAYINCPDDAHYSCRRFAFKEIRERLNQGLPPASILPETNVWTPDPGDPSAYDARIRDMGGIDLFILASGASDGHVAFNPPGSEIISISRVVEIAEATRRDNLGTFPEFKNLEEVPTHGVTVGIATIVQAKSAVLILHGSEKMAAAERLAACRGFDPDWPVSCIFECQKPEVLMDRVAANGLL